MKPNFVRSRSCFRWIAVLAALSAAALIVALTIALPRPATITLQAETQTHPEVRAQTLSALGRLPLSFEPNRGQADPRVKFLAHRAGFTAFLVDDGAVLSFDKRAPQMPDLRSTLNPQRMLRYVAERRPEIARPDYVALEFARANPAASVTGSQRLGGTVNYLLGNDPAKWQKSVPTYAQVKYRSIYPGIDAIFYGSSGRLEYDLDIAPGADPGAVRLRIDGTRRLELDRSGNLVLNGHDDGMVLGKPVAYQVADRIRVPVKADYVLANSSEIAIAVGKYDHTRTLVIDPAIIYSTYIGGTESQAQAIAVDSAGEAFVAGWTCCSDDFPVSGAEQPHLKGAVNAFVAKLSAGGNSLEYATYIGGSGVDLATGIGVDAAGNAYIEGMTDSADFPTLPLNGTAPGGQFDTFVTALNPTGSALLYSRYLGGSGDDIGTGIAVDAGGHVYVVGDTYSTDFPVTPSAYQTAHPSGGVVSSGFVARIDPPASAGADSTLAYASYLGGAGQQGTVLLLGAANAGPFGQVYVVGGGSSGFHTTAGSPFGGTSDAVVASFDTTQTGASSLLFSEFIGGSGLDMATAVATQPGCPNNCFAYVAGYTFSADLPNVAIEEQPIQGFADAFAAKVDPHSGVAQVDTEGTESFDEALGIGVDSKGDAIIGGLTLDAGKLQTAVTDSLQPMPSPSGALYSSTDGGASFGAMSWPLVAGSISLNGLAVDFSVLGNSPPAPPAIYGGTNSQGLFWSIDGGAHFFQGAVQGISSASPKVSAVSIMNAGTATGPLPVLAAVDNQIEVSGNEGQTFEKRASMPVSGVNIYFIYSDLYSGSGGTSGNFNVMVGTDHGLFHSTDFGNSWLASTGLAGTGQVTQVFTGVRDEATGDYYVGTDKGVFKSTDNAATFTPTNMNFAPVLSLARTITATLQTGGDGNPGNPASPGGPPTPTGVPTPPSATGGGTGFTITTTIYAGTYGDGVVTSTDGFNQNFSYGAGLPSSTFNYVTTDRTSSTDLNAYVGVGNNLGIGSVWQTADGGATFTQLGGNSFGPPCCVFPVVVGAGQMYAGDYREADGLVYWLSPDFNNRTVSNLGGSSYDQINGVAVDSSNDAYVTGLTYSNNFPLLGPAQSSFGPGGNALVNGFVTKLGYDDDSAVIKAPFIMGFGKHRMRIRTKPQTIVVENKAKSTTVRLGYIHVAGGGANSFQIISGAPSYTGSGATGKPGKRGLQPCGALLAPHSKCGVTVVFTPLGAGRTIAAVLVPSDAKNGTQATELTGQGYQVSARHQNR